MSELVKEFEEFFGRKANEIETLKARVVELEAAFQHRLDMAYRLYTERDELKSHVADLEGNNSALMNRVRALEIYNKEAFNQVMFTAENNSTLKSKLNFVTDELQLALNERDELKEQVAELEAVPDPITRAGRRTREELDKLKAHVATLEDYNRASYKRVVELEGRPYESLLEERKILRARVEALAVDLRDSDLAYHKIAGKGLALERERDQLRTELEAEKANHQATAEQNEYLSRELQALRPKPVVTYKYMMFVEGRWSGVLDNPTAHTNLKLTFHDGVLVRAEVIGEKK